MNTPTHINGDPSDGADRIQRPDMNTPFTDKKLKLRQIAESYKQLEESGHIPPGAVSENVNWDEIEALITEAQQETAKEIVKWCKENEWIDDSSDYSAVFSNDLIAFITSKYSPETNTQEPQA